MKLRVFSDKAFNRDLIRLAMPIAIQNLMLAAVAAADAFMLGGVAQNSMAAVSLASQIQFIQNSILAAIVSATVILGAQYWGKGDSDAMDIIFSMSFRSSALCSILFFIGCVFFPKYLMLLYTSDPELISIGVSYLRIAGWSYLMTGASQCYLAMMKVSEHTAAAARISSTSVVINIVLNAVFIFGLLGVPAMDVQGAATATLIARAIELGWCLVLSCRTGYFRLSFKGLLRHDALLFKDFMKCMIPLIGGSLLWGIGFTSYTSFMGHLGTDATAANSVTSVIRDLVCCLCHGLASGGGILVGNKLGAGDLKLGKLYGDRIAGISFICGIVSMLIMLAVTPAVMSFVKLTEGARSYLIGMMIIMAVYMIGRAVNTIIICGIFAAGGDTLFDMYSLIVTMWLLVVPLAALGTFVFHWPVLVVYACTCLDEVGKIPWVLIHYRKYKWVKDLTR